MRDLRYLLNCNHPSIFLKLHDVMYTSQADNVAVNPPYISESFIQTINSHCKIFAVERRSTTISTRSLI